MEPLLVLVVDDEPGMRMGIGRALRDFSVFLPETNDSVRFDVEEAASGEEAIDRIGRRSPDILLLDHKLPGISGLDVLDVFKDSQSSMLTIMITAYASIDKVIRATKNGAYDFLAKPFTPAELRTAVHKATEHLMMTRQARQLAQERRRVRFEFISVLAHELKAPINAVEGYLDLLREGTVVSGAPQFDECIDRCLTRIQYMRKMIMDLLDLTRIESGEKQRALTQVCLAEVVRAAIETVEPDARKRGITLSAEVPEALHLEADRSELDIVLNNLLSNAVKYNRDGGSVAVQVRESDDEVQIQVADTGIGMTEDEAGRLFQDFARIKNSRTSSILGSGLGLSIVKKLAVLYGGDASVRSVPDEGSTFTVRLRRQGAASQETAPCN